MKALYLTALSAIALTVTSCKDEVVREPEIACGNEVSFGAALDKKTRTIYGSIIEGDNNNKYYPIYWNYPNNLDRIFVYSPDAQAGRQQATYIVNPGSTEKETASEITKTGDVGIQWGDKATGNRFYGFYPGNESFNLSMTDEKTLTATLPGDQNPVFQTATNGEYSYDCTPDMSCCMMYAKNDNAASGETVSLNFQPLATVLDITVSGPSDMNTLYDPSQDWARVTSVVIEANAQITGTFTYNYETDQITATSQEAEDQRIMISTMIEETDNDGNVNLTGLRLVNDQKFNVKAFLIPNEAVSTITVTVHTSDNQEWKKTLNMNQYTQRQVNPVSLPRLRFAEAKFNYSTWITQLDPRIYLSQLSLPGTCLSFSGEDATLSDNQKPQTATIEEQYNLGIRVFQTHAWLVDGASPYGGNSRILVRNGDHNVNDKYLSDIVKELCGYMSNSHSNEFCVIVISDYPISGTNYTYAQFLERIKELTSHKDFADYFADNLGPYTTINDVKGKVIIKVQLRGNGADNGGTLFPGSSAALRSSYYDIMDWTKINGCKAILSQFTPQATTGVLYARLQYGGVGEVSTNLQFNSSGAGYQESFDPSSDLQISGNGIVYSAMSQLLSSTRWLKRAFGNNWFCSSLGTSALTTRPTDAQLEDDNTFWYIFSEQVNVKDLSQQKSNISNVVSAIQSDYIGKTNKRFCNYVGGINQTSGNIDGESNTIISFSRSLCNEWSTAIDGLTKNAPYGWVLFNRVKSLVDNTQGSATYGVNPYVKKVIDNNNKDGFTLQRDYTQSIDNGARKGDSVSPTGGGALFKPRR